MSPTRAARIRAGTAVRPSGPASGVYGKAIVMAATASARSSAPSPTDSSSRSWLLGAFPCLHAQADGAETVLAGALPDQAALYGVLAQIEALGLELLEVRRQRE